MSLVECTSGAIAVYSNGVGLPVRFWTHTGTGIHGWVLYDGLLKHDRQVYPERGEEQGRFDHYEFPVGA